MICDLGRRFYWTLVQSGEGPTSAGEEFLPTRTAGQVVVTVDDTGPGVPDQGPRIFEAFVTSRQDCMGRDLSIARTIANVHGGALERVPRDGAGSRVELRLPCL